MSSLSPDQHPSSQLQGFYGWTDTLKGVYYGPGSFEYALPKLRTAIGGTKALIVTGRSLYHKTDIVKKVEEVLRRDGAYGGTFWEIGEHSPIADIRAGLDAFCTARADYIVAVGGGSPVDASKAILYMLRERDGGELKRQIAIPTTLSAAEYTIGAGYTNDEGHKVAISDQGLAPSGVILDAELTLATPEKLWLSTGMRAVDHAIENLYRPLVIPPIKALCRQALRDLFSYLPQSKANPTDITIRQKLQLASWMSLWPMRLEEYSALGLSHALGHKLGAAYSIPHGFTSCLTLASVVRLKARTASEEDKEWLSGTLFYLGEAGTGSLEQDVQKLANLIERLVKDLDLMSSLGEYSVPREDLSKIAEQALGGRTKDFPAVVTLLEGLYETTL